MSQKEPYNSSFAPCKHNNSRKNLSYLNKLRVLVLALIGLTCFTTAFSSAPGAAFAEDNLKPGTVARVSNTDGDGVRMRTSPSTTADTIQTLSETWQVTILGGPVKDNRGNNFYKVEWANRTGYVMTQYVSRSGSGGFALGSQVRVAGTDGDGVRLRTAANTGSGTIVTLEENWLATVVGGPFRDNQGNNYYRLEWTGKTGFANSEYLAYAGKSGNVTTSTQSNSSSNNKLTIGGQAKVSGTDGEGVRLRQQPNPLSATLSVLGETYLVTVLGGTFRDSQGNNYYRVEWAGYTGFVRAEFLSPASKNAVAGQGGYMRVTNTDGDPIRFRTAPSKNSALNGYVYEGQVYKLLAGPFKDIEGNNWYRLDRNGEVGYVLGTFLQRTNSATPVNNPAPARTQPRNEAPAARPIPVPPSTGPTGQRLADYAKQFVGYRYVYAGKTPAAGGFDCSGFVHWVYGQTLDVFTGWTAADNSRFGVEVPLSALEPGDILVWANTYMPGPSHSGIYIGGGRFVHAANESTGVTINALNEPYYSSRFYTARRINV